MFKKYYQKSIQERINILQKADLINELTVEKLEKDTLHLIEGNHLIENFITNYEIPLGIATGFLIDGINYVVPMATEEPSVIAAASNAASMIAKSNGFITQMHKKHLIGQIVLEQYDLEKMQNLDEKFWIEKANQAYPSILKRGGGVKKIWFEKDEEFGVIYVELDAKDAMGANMMNTILESLAQELRLQQNHVLMAILSNHATEALVKAKFELSFNELNKEICEKIVKANHFASKNIYRTATHNKGIMNGITAVVLATGNDTRAIESSVHTYLKGSVPTKYYCTENSLVGEIEVPINISVVGGCIRVHPTAQMCLQILKNPSAIQLAKIIACVGLAQNFAALKALVTKGIQAGHMKLHYRSMILSLGAKEDEVDIIIENLSNEKIVNEKIIRDMIQKMR